MTRTVEEDASTMPARTDEKAASEVSKDTSETATADPESMMYSPSRASVMSRTSNEGDDEQSLNARSVSSSSISSKSTFSANYRDQRHLQRQRQRRSSGMSASQNFRVRQTRRSQKSFDGNASTSLLSTKPSKSLSDAQPRTSVTRPEGMRERMQQRLRMQTAYSERNLNAYRDDDDRSVSSRRSMSSVGVGSVRERLASLKVPSIRRISNEISRKGEDEDSLLLHMSQKVRQLEQEKTKLQEMHQQTVQDYDTRLARLEQREQSRRSSVATIQEGHDENAPSPRHQQQTSPTALQNLQAKLDKALAKINRLEDEQSQHQDLEEQLQDAHIKIANLQLQSPAVQRHMSTPTQISSSNSSSPSGTTEKREASPEKENGDVEERKPESPTAPAKKASSFFDIFKSRPSPLPPSSPSTSTKGFVPSAASTKLRQIPLSSREGEDQDEEQQQRNEKLDKLKAFRRSRESQLKELVLESQDSPTDVQTVIRNLQDELQAAKELMSKQSAHIDNLKETLKLKQEESEVSRATEESDANNTASSEETQSLAEKYQDLQRRHVQLQLDRAFGEFQLRDKVTGNALKFHRRLRHWKEQAQESQEQLEASMEQHAAETKGLRDQIQAFKQMAMNAEKDLKNYKLKTEESLQSLADTKDRLARVTADLVEAKANGTATKSSTDATVTTRKQSSVEDDPTILNQATFLENAMKSKQQQQSGWSIRAMIRSTTTARPPEDEDAEQVHAMG